ncbi:MAG: hypothetical protein R8G01_12260 [Ilumatobacteraceae bacterium]|nr:hypothetical protein [Ilumatobacteraceae bacterium]
MSTVVVILLALLVVTVVFVAVVLARTGRPVTDAVGQPPGPVGGAGAVVEEVPEVEPVGVIALTTDRPNEVYLFGSAAELEEFGPSLATAPRQLARYATGLRVGLDAAESFAELSGRLVLVDNKTAAALRAGRMMKSKSGEVLAKVLREDGKISSVTRLKDIGSLATTAASLTNVLSAMAMQAQLDRIERQLTKISDGIDRANRELLLQWHAEALGAQDVLREVYTTATRAGELTPANWSQIATIGHVARKQLRGDRRRLVDAVTELERAVAAKNVKTRLNDIESRVYAVTSAHAALSESTRTWAQFSALRLWHFTVTDDKTLEAYRDELHTFIESSRNEIEPLRERASAACSQLGEHRWTAKVRHPRVVRRLPGATDEGLAILDRVNWQPLELQQPSIEIAIAPTPVAAASVVVENAEGSPSRLRTTSSSKMCGPVDPRRSGR